MTNESFYKKLKSIVGWYCEIEADDLRHYIDVKGAKSAPPRLTFDDVENVAYGGLMGGEANEYADAYVSSAWHVPLNRPCTAAELEELSNAPEFYKELEKYLK